MKTLGFIAGAAIAMFAGSAIAADGSVPTGYEVEGCLRYKLDTQTWRVTQICEEDVDAAWERIAAMSGPGPDGGDGGEGEGSPE